MVSKEFTTQKLNWLQCVCFDRRLNDGAFRVASVIAFHLNEASGRAYLSADTIAAMTGSKWPRKVARAIKLLKDTGWLNWERTKDANVYKPNYRNVKATLEVIGRLRFEKRQKLRQSRQTRTPASHCVQIYTE